MPWRKQPPYVPYRQRKDLTTRRAEVTKIRATYPSKVPVVVERYHREKYLPLLDKVRFLAPTDMTVSRFVATVRSRMSLQSSKSIFLFVNTNCLPCMSATMGVLYRDEKDEDGFLYMTYSSQETFGACPSFGDEYSTGHTQ